MTLEQINAKLKTKFTLVKRDGTVNESNARIVKRLSSMNESDIDEFMRTDAGWNMSASEKHAKGYHALRALDKWYKEHGNDNESSESESGASDSSENENNDNESSESESGASENSESDSSKSSENESNSGNDNDSEPEQPKPNINLSDNEKQVLAMITRPQFDGKPNNVYLHGPAGTGKSYMIKRIADAIDAGYWETGIVNMKEELLGFTDAGGRYIEPECVKILKNGKAGKKITIMLFDEFDGMPNSVTLTWNNIFASRRFTTPQGTFNVHPSVRFVATGNTTMDGSDEFYDRETVDKSVKTRWLFKAIDYDKKIEKKLADADIVEFLQGLRRAKNNCGLDLFVTYREFTALQWAKGIIADGIMDAEQALDTCVFKGLTDDDKDTLRGDRMIQKLIENKNVWALAL